MATKKKAKAKAKTKTKKTKKKAATRKTAPKKVARKSAAKKVAAKKRPKAKPRAAETKPSTAPAPSQATSKPAPAAPAAPTGERLGIVEHYYSHLSVAVIRLEAGTLREGELVHIKGHTSDFMQRVESMEVEHARVSEARAGQSVGVRVREHAREHDVVYKVAQ